MLLSLPLLETRSPTWPLVPAVHLVRAQDGAPLRQQTFVRAALWHTTLLVRFECADADAWGTYSERDDPLWREEAVEVFLAPGDQTPQRYCEAEVSPRGVLFDALVENPDGDRATMCVDAGWSWSGIEWRVGSLGAAQDWWCELRLPLRALVPESLPLPELWRANFYRIERPRSGDLPEEYAAWSPTLRDPADFHVPERFGTLARRGRPTAHTSSQRAR